MPFKDFCFIRLMDIFRLKNKIKKEGKEKYINEMSKLDIGMKCVLKVCLLPDNQFITVIKYL